MKIVIKLILLTLIANTVPCIAMDIEPQKQSSLLQLPDEVLERIIMFVVEKNPDAMGDLIKIQGVCKQLATFLSKDQMKWILKLDQATLNNYFLDAIKKFQYKKIKLFLNLGAQFDKTYILFYLLLNALTILQTPQNYLKLLTIIELLEAKGATWPTDNDQTNLFTQAINRNASLIVKILLDGGKKANNFDLLSAITNYNKDVVYQLLEHGTVPHAMHLAEAVKRGYTEIVKLLIEYKTDVNGLDDIDNTPLVYAKNPDIARMLLDAGANLHISCRQHSTPFQELIRVARRHKDPTILIEVLKQRYSLETATAIALALLAGASVVSAVCTIL